MTTMAPLKTHDRRSAASAGTAPGWIVIARHGQPDADRTVRLTSRQYVDWWSAYDRTGLKAGEVPPECLLVHGREADVVFASTLPRAMRTAEAAAPGKDIITDPVFVEAPLPPPNIPGLRTPGLWGAWARVSWWFGNAAGLETRQQAELRAEAAVATLTARALRGENVMLCAHGWFNRMMRPVLRAQGWREVENKGDRYWSHRRYVKVR
jgi:broad specificity phosphatase PhoE